MADKNHDDAERLLQRLADRYWDLTTSAPIDSEALTQVAVGLNAFLEEVRDDPTMLPEERLRRALDAMELFADAVQGPPSPVTTSDDTPTVDININQSVQQFVDAFRSEAQRRLAGLSLSLTGVFNSEPKAIEQTINHLHAIRGGAGMLGMDAIAKLAGAMEDVVTATRRDDEGRWPVRPLLRGFATLESAIEDPDSGYDNIVQSITDELRGHLTEETAPEPFESGADTGIRKQPLDQRILVVDDIETIAHSVGLILSELDIPIDVATNGRDALEHLQNRPYSLVITDIAMPEMNGLDLTRAIREDEALSDLPVILLTALDRDNERDAGLEAGASDYIVKGSIGGGELISRVKELLEAAPVVPGRPDEQGPFRKVLIVEDIETIAASIAFVLSEGPYEMTLAHNGLEALDLIDEEPFDLVISDVEMPGMDGYELLNTLKGDEDHKNLPVILLTGRESDVDRQTALEAGASRFLIKGEVGGGKLLSIVGDFFDGD